MPEYRKEFTAGAIGNCIYLGCGIASENWDKVYSYDVY